MSETGGTQAVVEASLDVVVDGSVMGWARDPRRRGGIALLQLRLGERHIATFSADGFRPDLRDAGFGSGHHGFEVPVPRDIWSHAQRSGDRITCSPFGEPDLILFVIDEDERLAPHGWLKPVLAEALSVRDEPARSLIDATSVASACYDKLFSPVIPVAAEGAPGLFPYAEHVRHREGVADRFAPSLVGPDLDHFLRWYLEDYAAARAPFRAPLSADVIRWLNGPVVIGGRRHAPTRAMLWFMTDGEHGLAKLDDEEAYLDLIYWWACERAPRLAAEDCLVPRSQIDALRRVPEHWKDRTLPLSSFMERALVRRPTLSGLGGMQSLSARVTAYTLLIAEAAKEPGLLRFMPLSVLNRFLGGPKPLLDSVAAALFTGDSAIRPLTAELYRVGLARSGFDLDTVAFRSVGRDGHRCEAILLGGSAPPAAVDVQVIGPFSKASGVARVARLSRAALAATGLSVAAFDCAFDNRQPDEDGATGATALPATARVNLVHLNADTLPAAFAYLPDLRRGTYTIGFFFWELDHPSECHRLALDLVDEVWVASDYNRRCFAAWTDKPVTDVSATLDVGPTPSREAAAEVRWRICRAEPTDFVVMTSFDALSFVARKNPLGLVRAFTDAFARDPTVRLVIKTHNTGVDADVFARRLWDEVMRLAASDERLVVVDATLSFADVMALTAASDCYASLHRSEGMGLGMLEAMRLGVPVLCTAYSGNLDFCDDETAWLVEADEVPVPTRAYAYVMPGHRWAEPRHAEAVAAFRALRSDVALRRARAEAARERVLQRHSIDAAAKRYAARLNEILEGLRSSTGGATEGAEGSQGRMQAQALAGTRRSRLFAWPRGGA